MVHWLFFRACGVKELQELGHPEVCSLNLVDIERGAKLNF